MPLGVLVVTCYQPRPDPAWLREQQEIGEELLKLVRRLPKPLDRVITTSYGLQGKERQTMPAIGEQLELSGKRVGQLRHEALVWLCQQAEPSGTAQSAGAA